MKIIHSHPRTDWVFFFVSQLFSVDGNVGCFKLGLKPNFPLDLVSYRSSNRRHKSKMAIRKDIYN